VAVIESMIARQQRGHLSARAGSTPMAP